MMPKNAWWGLDKSLQRQAADASAKFRPVWACVDKAAA